MGYQLKRAIFLSEIAKEINMQFVGVDILITAVSSFSDLDSGCLSFTKDLCELNAGSALVVPKDIALTELDDNGYLLSNNPRLDFIRSLSFLEEKIGFSTYDFTSKIHSSAIIGKNVVIEDGCHIAENVTIEHNVVIHAGTRVGRNSRIRSCSSIGGDGFGFEKLTDGTPLRFPHLGGVLIGEEVEIGSCTTIACGTLSDTVIDDFVKIDNLVHVAHNCHIKKRVFITACAEISGSVVIEEDAWIAPNSCIKQKIVIGKNSLVGIGAAVTKNISSGSVCFGNPAKKIRSIK